MLAAPCGRGATALSKRFLCLRWPEPHLLYLVMGHTNFRVCVFPMKKFDLICEWTMVKKMISSLFLSIYEESSLHSSLSSSCSSAAPLSPSFLCRQTREHPISFKPGSGNQKYYTLEVQSMSEPEYTHASPKTER